MVTNDNTYRSEVHFCGIGGYDVMNTAVLYVWEPRYCHAIFVGQQNGFVTAQVPRYVWVVPHGETWVSALWFQYKGLV